MLARMYYPPYQKRQAVEKGTALCHCKGPSSSTYINTPVVTGLLASRSVLFLNGLGALTLERKIVGLDSAYAENAWGVSALASHRYIILIFGCLREKDWLRLGLCRICLECQCTRFALLHYFAIWLLEREGLA